MLNWVILGLTWACGLLLMLSCIGFVLAVRELYLISRNREQFSVTSKLLILIISLPVINIITVLAAIVHSCFKSGRGQKRSKTVLMKKM